MRVLVTGATGYIGGGITRALLTAGDEVRALVREPDRAPEGVEPVRGDLDDPTSLVAATDGVDGVIHAAASPGDADGALDLAAAGALVEALAGSGRFLVFTSGTWVTGPTGDTPAAEDAPLDPPAAVAWRPRNEQVVLAATARGIRTSIVRAGTVHGRGGGYVPKILAPVDGMVRPFGEGHNRWSTVHVDDLGELYRLAAVHSAPGRIFNGVSEVVIAGDVARAVAAVTGASVEPLDLAAARSGWGAWADAFAMDHAASGDRARRELGWVPRHPSPVHDAADVLGLVAGATAG